MVKLPKRFSVGERIFAKVRGYPPWPAKIENITDPNLKQAKYHVVFFGTREIATCKVEDLFQYEENKEKFSKSIRRKYFLEGLQELEEDLRRNPNPPSHNFSRDLSITENIPDNSSESITEHDSTVYNDSSMMSDIDNESGNLIIDEGEKKKNNKRKSTISRNTPDITEAKKKRGRKSAVIPGENTSKHDISQDLLDEDAEKKVVSRSGRKIKPKRFHDGEELPLESSRNEDESKQGKFELNLESQMKINDIPNRTLRTESQIIFLDTQIRSSLGLEQANTDECIDAMDQLKDLEITALMLKKHSHTVETIKRLRRYVGNLKKWKLSEEEEVAFIHKAEQIQKKAEEIYKKFKSLFTVPDGMTFWQYFVAVTKQFQDVTKDMTDDQRFSLISDPTENLPLNKDVNEKNDKKTEKNDEQTKEPNKDELSSEPNEENSSLKKNSALDASPTKKVEEAEAETK